MFMMMIYFKASLLSADVSFLLKKNKWNFVANYKVSVLQTFICPENLLLPLFRRNRNIAT